MSGRQAGESQRSAATAYAAFSSSFQAEPAHTRQTPKSSATWRKRGPQTRLETHDEVPPRRWAVASTLRLCGRLTVSASWPCRIAPARQRLQAHQSLTMHLAGPTIAERAISRRHLGEHPARPRGRWRRGLRPTPTARGPAGTRSASCNAANGPACVHPAVRGL